MKVDELKDNDAVIKWFGFLNARPNTEKIYLLSMQWFTEWTGKEPQELIADARAEIRAGLFMDERKILTYLIGFRKYLQEKKLAPHTVKGYMTGVKSFYQSYYIEIPKLPKAGNRAQTLKKHKDIPKKEDLQEVLKVCDPLEKAVLLVGVSSGVSANEICSLKVSDFKKGFDPETEITILDLRREKVGFDFISFLSPEASRAVNGYLDYRARTEKTKDKRILRGLENQRVFSDDNYLFIKRHIDPSFSETHNDELRKYDHQAFMKLYRTISLKARKNTPSGDWNLIRSHNMRKYFNSTLLNAGCDSFFVEFVMGHTLDDTRAAYFRASPEKLREQYQKFIPYLTIEKAAAFSEETYKDLKAEVEKYKADAEAAKVDRYEYLAQENELDVQRQWIGEQQRQIDELKAKLTFNEALNTTTPEQMMKDHENAMKTDPEYRKKFNSW